MIDVNNTIQLVPVSEAKSNKIVAKRPSVMVNRVGQFRFNAAAIDALDLKNHSVIALFENEAGQTKDIFYLKPSNSKKVGSRKINKEFHNVFTILSPTLAEKLMHGRVNKSAGYYLSKVEISGQQYWRANLVKN